MTALDRDHPTHRGQPHLNADVLILGAGLAGLTAAFDLVETGRKVVLIETSGSHGGTLSLLDRQFPTESCGFCQILPQQDSPGCLKSILDHPRIAFSPFSTLETVNGKAGNFTVRVNRKSTGVDASRCTHCGLCIQVCPETYPDPLQGGSTERKAIGYRTAVCTPSRISVEWEHCTQCGECVNICPEGAVDPERWDRSEELRVGAIIVATGLAYVDPSDLQEYGYGHFSGVITTLELERILGQSLLHGEMDLEDSAGRRPSRIAWIQCAGSRNEKRPYCSSACCMISLKEARLIRELQPDAHLEIFFMDMRTCGKGYDRYLAETKERGITLTRGRPSEVSQRDGSLWLQVEDEKGRWREDPFDLVVLSVGFEASEETRRLAEILGFSLDEDGFAQITPGSLSRTDREGIYVAGTVAEPKDIPDTVMQAHEAAARAFGYGTADNLTDPPRAVEATDPGEVDLRVFVALCDCSETLASGLEFDTLRTRLKNESQVVGTNRYRKLCQPDGISALHTDLKTHKANALVLGACTPRWLRPRLRQLFSDSALDPNLIQFVNLREQGVWSHDQGATGVTHRMLSELRGALAMCLAYRPLSRPVRSEHPSGVLVVGGGPAGISAASCLAELGHPVTLVEREAKLGGNLQWMQYGLVPEFQPQELKETLLAQLSASSNIQILMETTAERIQGRPGRFRVSFAGAQGTDDRSFGAIILATGGRIFQPEGYFYGRDSRVMTQKDLELALSRMDLDPSALGEVAMIQCVGPRDERHPYCSRICCAAALKNAQRLLDANPRLRLYVFYRDMMAFGTLERHYRTVRERGALFVHFEPADPPRLERHEDRLCLEAQDPLLDLRVRFHPDLIILNSGMVPEVPSGLLEDLGLRINEEGFLHEVNAKFRPLDLRDGIFACGLARGPAFLGEATAQGRGAAMRAAAFLERNKGLSSSAVVQVHEARCAACGLCVSACPYDAREIAPELGYALIHHDLCRACGTCSAVCPNDAAQLEGGTDRQVLSAIDAMFES